MANFSNTTLYIGVTNNLERRVAEHKSGSMDGFTKQYHVNKLVYWESTPDVENAIAREKQLKRWTRAKKEWLVEATNPEWRDLALSF